jgi:hypothetical protein
VPWKLLLRLITVNFQDRIAGPLIPMRKRHAIFLTKDQRFSSGKNWIAENRGINLLIITDCRSTIAEIASVVPLLSMVRTELTAGEKEKWTPK